MQSHGGLHRPRPTDLDLPPTDAADSETEHLRDGFLRRPPAREMQDVRAAVHLLPLGIDAIEEASRMLLEHIADPRCLDDVDADLRAHARSGRVRRVLSRGRGRALAAPSPPSASFASLTPRGGSPGHPRLAHTPLPRATRRTQPISLSLTRPSRPWRDCAVGPHRSLFGLRCDTRAAGAELLQAPGIAVPQQVGRE